MARVAQLTDWLERLGGIAHTSELRAGGFTEHDVRVAVASGTVRRLRRSWLVTRSAPPAALAAIEVRGRLTCFSEAARLGLWTPPHEDLHVAVPSSSSSPRQVGVRFHRSTGPTPTARHAWREPILNVLHHVSVCGRREEALAVWESAIRLGRVPVDHLALVAWSAPRARELAQIASVLSDSGLESIALDRLRPFGLGIRQQVRIEGHPVDLLIGDRLIVQIDGFGFHSEAKDRRRDIAHDARLMLKGYSVLRFDYVQILFHWPEVESAILLAIAQGRHLAA